MVTFEPQHTYIVWPDYTGTGGRIVYADTFEVTQGGALVFSSRGDDGDMHVTRVISPYSYAHMSQIDGASVNASNAMPLVWRRCSRWEKTFRDPLG
jgi:hypothetical protein